MDLILKSEGLEMLSEEALMTVEGGVDWDRVLGAVAKYGKDVVDVASRAGKAVVDTFYYAGYKVGHSIGR